MSTVVCSCMRAFTRYCLLLPNALAPAPFDVQTPELVGRVLIGSIS